MKQPHTSRLVILGVLAGALSALGGCRGDREGKPPRQFFPDLDDQLKWTPQNRSEMFADARTMRPTVANTVAFGPASVLSDEGWASVRNQKRDDLLNNDPLLTEGVIGRDAQGNPIYTPTIPSAIAVDKAMVLRGQERFNIYCSACHGHQGDGVSRVAEFYSPAPANFHTGVFKDPKAVQSLDGYIFHTIRHGKPKPGGDGFTMPSYGHAINVHDAWAIVAYVRALQATREGSVQDVPEAMRADLMKSRPAASPGATPSEGGRP